MIANTLFAASALASLVAAIPLAQPPFPKRDIVWETHTEVALTTIPVTVTHWLEPGETAPADANVAPAAAGNKQHYGHHGHGKGQGHGGYGQGQPPAQPETTQTSAAPAPPAPSSYEQPTSQAAPPPPAAPTRQAASLAYTPPVQPSPQPQPQPSPAPQPSPEPQSSPEPAPTYGSGGGSSSDGSSSGGLSGMAAPGTSYTGDLTYYTPGLGACGTTSTSSEHIVAISEAIFDSYDNGNPNNNPLCGKMVSITGEDGSQYSAEIVDRCPGCAEADLDLSPDFFKLVVPTGDGRVPGVEWSFE